MQGATALRDGHRRDVSLRRRPSYQRVKWSGAVWREMQRVDYELERGSRRGEQRARNLLAYPKMSTRRQRAHTSTNTSTSRAEGTHATHECETRVIRWRWRWRWRITRTGERNESSCADKIDRAPHAARCVARTGAYECSTVLII